MSDKDNPEAVLTKSWRELPRGGYVLEAGNAQHYITGTWGTFEPVLHLDLCIQCLLCWVACPDSAILVDDKGEVSGIDLLHCKGCSICQEICPTKPDKAIVMKKKEI